MLYCCLGEIDDDDELFARAWEMSGKRYARAMRLLGKRLHARGEFEKSIESYEEALAVNPNFAHAWWKSARQP